MTGKRIIVVVALIVVAIVGYRMLQGQKPTPPTP